MANCIASISCAARAGMGLTVGGACALRPVAEALASPGLPAEGVERGAACACSAALAEGDE